jgi:hypothetical protein
MIQLIKGVSKDPYVSREVYIQATQVLWRLVQNQELALDQRLQVTTALFDVSETLQERFQAVQLILNLLQGETARKYLEQLFSTHKPFYNTLNISDISYMVELIQQDLLPSEVRDELYQQLPYMVSQFDKLDQPTR